ncbi:MAG: SDR family oxidoreductase [Firmicutes bacterium]|nr:SDR family oxidoreductase [Bacillota bacterium]
MNHRPLALVTGAGRGIGRVIAEYLGDRGYDVALHYWDEPDAAQATAQDIGRRGGRAACFRGDLADERVPRQLVADVIAKFGRLDAVVNNAGVVTMRPFVALSDDDLDRTYRINYRAPFVIAQEAARWMVEHRVAGAIVHITSVHQERASNWDSAYGSMKAALARATESMALELAPHGIRVNAVAPGRIVTPERQKTADPAREQAVAAHIPLGESGDAWDVARAVAWLLSSEARYVTGITLRVDGGLNLPIHQALVDGRLEYI